MHDLQAQRRYRIAGYRPAIGDGFRQRLFSMGLLPGAALKVRRVAPLGDPMQVETRQSSLVLRRKDLAIWPSSRSNDPARIDRPMDELRIGLIGNPNSGKTTLFNQLTGSRQRVGNWAGVTVERKEGSVPHRAAQRCAWSTCPAPIR